MFRCFKRAFKKFLGCSDFAMFLMRSRLFFERNFAMFPMILWGFSTVNINDFLPWRYTVALEELLMNYRSVYIDFERIVGVNFDEFIFAILEEWNLYRNSLCIYSINTNYLFWRGEISRVTGWTLALYGCKF